jgi:hypothetical protein
MVAFREVVGNELPVGVDLDAVPRHPDRRVHRVVAIEGGHRIEEFGKGRPLVIHRVPDEAAPAVAAQFPQLQLATRIAPAEIDIAVLRVPEHAVDAPAPAVVGAMERLDRTLAIDHAHAAMAAGIVERTNRAVLLPHRDHRFLQEIVHDEVAGLGDVGQASGDVPDARPEVVPFLLREFPRIVAVAGHGIAAKVGGIAAIHRRRNRRLVVHLLARRHATSPLRRGRCHGPNADRPGAGTACRDRPGTPVRRKVVQVARA